LSSWHIAKISTRLSHALYILRTVKDLLPEKILKNLYYTLFHCHLVYGAEIWGSASDRLLNKIYQKQKIAIRLICGKKYNSHTEPLFKKTEILKLHDIIKFTRISLMQESIQKLSPVTMHSIWIKNRDHRILTNNYVRELRNDNDYMIPSFRIDLIKRTPLIDCPSLWNELPPEIQIVRNKIEFKSKLKMFFMNKLSENIQCNRLLCPSCHLNI